MISNKSSSLSNNGMGGTPNSKPFEQESEVTIKAKQQRLFLLYHSQKCQNADGQCPVTKNCGKMKQLWLHINKKCKDNRCGFPHCCSSRAILNHYRKCTDAECRVCGPVRKAILMNDSRLSSTRGVEETSIEQSSSGGSQKQKVRQKSLHLHLKLLRHASSCMSSNCPSPNCAKMKAYLFHSRMCEERYQGGCQLCDRIWTLINYHADSCKNRNCTVTNCQLIKEK